MDCEQLNLSELSLTSAEVFEAMGYSNEKPEEVIAEAVFALLKEAEEKIHPSCYFTIRDVRISGNEICTGNTVFETGKIIARLMKGAERLALFVATAGREFEAWTQTLKKEGDYLNQYIVDSIGTCIVEKTGDYLEKLLEAEIGDTKHTNRFSPGYCGWHVSEQRKFFALLPENICGIELKESCLMIPIKSISGIIGIGTNVKTKLYSCHVCDMKSCFRRRNAQVTV